VSELDTYPQAQLHHQQQLSGQSTSNARICTHSKGTQNAADTTVPLTMIQGLLSAVPHQEHTPPAAAQQATRSLLHPHIPTKGQTCN
jgi:hypothetical protein